MVCLVVLNQFVRKINHGADVDRLSIKHVTLVVQVEISIPTLCRLVKCELLSGKSPIST